MRALLILLLAAWMAPMALAATPAASTPRNETARIEALIDAVGRLEGAVFIRNGSEHTAAEAASHLRLKWRNASRRVHTAEEFIGYCATASSMTGRKYRIRFADGHEVDSADYFRAELRRYDAAHPAVRPAPASTPG